VKKLKKEPTFLHEKYIPAKTTVPARPVARIDQCMGESGSEDWGIPAWPKAVKKCAARNMIKSHQ